MGMPSTEAELFNWLRERLDSLIPPGNVQAQISYATGTLKGDLTSSLTNVLRVPVGSMFFLPDTTVPASYLATDGTVYNIADYPDLGALLAPHSGLFGGNGTSTFGVPDTRGRIMVGLGTNANVQTIGQREFPLVALGSRSPHHLHQHIHSHGMEHNHPFTSGNDSASKAVADAPHQHSESGGGTTGNQNANATVAAHTHTHSGTTGNTSNGGQTGDLTASGQEDTDTNAFPYLTLYGIIKT